MHPILVSRLQLVLAFLLTVVNAHSWVEELTVIASNGTFVGVPGYARGNVFRTVPDFNDGKMTHLTPPNGRANQSRILSTDKMCMPSQRKQVQTDGSPRLQARPGASVALRFQENGHVTLPQNQPGKPPNRGTVYVYGTTQPKDDENLLDVHKVWNRAGTGGDGRGVLLSVQNFDDGRCYQINDGKISTHRQSKFPHKADQLMGADIWCQQDMALPANAPTGKPYTLYWVWDWPTRPGHDPALPNGKQEIYTTCMDVDVVDHPETHVRLQADYAQGQPLDKAAIPSQFAELHGLGPSSVSHSTTSSAIPSASSAHPRYPTRSVQPPRFVTIVKTIHVHDCEATPGPEVTPVKLRNEKAAMKPEG